MSERTLLIFIEELVVEIVIDVTHAVIGTRQILMMYTVLPVAIITVAEAATVLVQGLLMMIDTIDLVVALVVMMMIELELGAHAATAMAVESEAQAPNAPRANPLHLSQRKTSEIVERSLYSNLLPD